MSGRILSSIKYILAQAVVLSLWINDWRMTGDSGWTGEDTFLGAIIFVFIFAVIPAIIVGLIDGLVGGREEGWIARPSLIVLLFILAVWVSMYGGVCIRLEDFFAQYNRPPSIDIYLSCLVAMELVLAIEIGVAILVRWLRR